MVLVLLSCGRDQSTGPMRAPGGVARGLSFNAIFPSTATIPAFASIVAFERVRVVLHHTDGSLALDTLVSFPANADSVTLSFDVTLAPGTPAAGELLSLTLAYINAKGDTIFRGGPAPLRAAAAVAGSPPPQPVSISVVYSGPGASAQTIRIAPRTLTVNAGAPFAFTGTASNAAGAAVADAPIAWVTPDPTLANLPVPTVGSGTANASRGAARIIALLINGAADTVALNVIPAATAVAAVSGNNQSGLIGKPTSQALAQPIVVRVTAGDGLGVPGVTVTFAAANGGGVGATTVVTDAAGLAQTTWSLATTGTTQTATATVASLAGSPVTFSATGAAKAATKLVLTSAPVAGANIPSGSPAPLVVGAQDVDGDPALGFTGDVTVALSTNPTEATLAGTVTVAAVSGVASFPAISIAKPGVGYVLQATSGTLAPVSTNAFNIVTGPAANITLVSGGGQTAEVGAPVTIKVLVADANGNPNAGATVAFAPGATFGSVTPASVVTGADGTATAVWTLGSALGAQALTATTGSLTPLSVTATAVAAVRTWVITQQPSASVVAGSAISPAIRAELHDGNGAVVSSFGGTVTIGLASSPSEAPLRGTTSVTAVNGVASFPDLVLTQAGAYALVLKASGAPDMNTNAFNIVAAAGAGLSVASGGSQSGSFGAMLAAPVVLKVVDAYGNPVAGTAVTFAVASGGGSVGTPSATTNASGLASTTWTLGSSGAQSITGSSAGLTGSPITISAVTASGSIAATDVSPRYDTLTSLGATAALSAQARDVSGGAIAGSFSWTSRNSLIATVSSGGVLTAVANGSTYVVAQEIGGTRDSALVVVQQRVASVNITPGSRALYVTGTFAYSAVAVDGRGNAMASQPTFTWSSTSPSVASVDASSGAVTALAIGTTQIRATAGNTVGVSPLTVQTPIKRIVVSIDTGSVAATVPDTFTMTSLGLRRAYRAIARDTIDNVMAGVTFTWSSTNASVAAMDTPGATTAGAISAANGITSIQATAQGVTGGATLYVAQVLKSIELAPATASVGVGGSTALLARGRDSLSRYISGGSFTYSSSGPSFATVSATTGVVTGVSIGSTIITATSGNIKSNDAAVTVSNSGPAVISFGRDTIGVGRGTSVAVPILLSRAIGTSLVVNLAASDTNAYWSTATVTIPANATSANATLNGRNAGTTRVSALDGSGAGYTGDTAVVAVQANMRLTTTYYSMNQTDQVATQVLLSDPSPAGGTYVTFSYGTANKAQVSPDPAFIPAGQLAADIVIRGVGGGSTTLTPLATGVSGTGATVVVSAAVLNVAYSTLRLGAGQYEAYPYVSLPNSVNTPLLVTLTSSDSSVASTAPSITIPALNSYAYFEVDGRAPGFARIIASANGWTPDTLLVTTTTPRVTACCSNTINSTAPAQSLTIYSADSAFSAHARLSSLAVRVTSSDTTVMKVLDTLVTINAGTYYSTTARVIPKGIGGRAWIYIAAGGHSPDSVLYTVVGPALSFGQTSHKIGVGQSDANTYITIPNAIATPLVVTLVNSDSTIGATDQSVTIPAGSYYAYFPVRGRGVGSNTIIATASGYIPDTLYSQVTSPILRIAGSGALNAYSTYSTNVYTEDTDGSAHPRITDLTISIRSSDTTVVKVDTSVVIPAGYYYAPSSLRVTAVNTGTAKIYVTAPGHATDSATFTVTPAKLSLSIDRYELGARQHQYATSFYVYVPDARTISVPVTMTHSNPAVAAFSPASPTIAANATYTYFDIAGLVTGVDTVIANASGYLPDTAYIRVSTPHFLIGSFPSSGTTTNPPATVTVYVADSSGNAHYASDTIVVHAVSSDDNVIKPTAAYFRVVKDLYYANPTFQYVGPGTATITYSDSANSGYLPATTGVVTVTGPTLTIIGGNPGVLGTGQHTSVGQYYVLLPNAVGAPLTVSLVSTDPRVATVDNSITIPAGQSYAYFTITAQDTIGTVQIQATATGYTASSTNMQVTKPMFVISTPTSVYQTTPPNYVVVYATDANGSQHLVNADVVVTLQSSSPGVASIDSTRVTIVSGTFYSNQARWTPGTVGTATLTASDSRDIRYPYTTSAANVTVATPPAYLSIGTGVSLGTGQYLDAYTQIPYSTTSAISVPLTHAANATTSTPANVTIPANNNYVYFRILGTSTGSDTITASPPNHTAATGTVNVGLGRIDGIGSWPTSMKQGDSTLVTLYTRSPDNNTARYVAAATTFSLASGSPIEFHVAGSTVTSVTVPIDTYYVQFYVKAVSTGTASVTMTNANYVTYTSSISVSP